MEFSGFSSGSSLGFDFNESPFLNTPLVKWPATWWFGYRGDGSGPVIQYFGLGPVQLLGLEGEFSTEQRNDTQQFFHIRGSVRPGWWRFDLSQPIDSIWIEEASVSLHSETGGVGTASNADWVYVRVFAPARTPVVDPKIRQSHFKVTLGNVRQVPASLTQVQA
jgi:hypothetical protein